MRCDPVLLGADFNGLAAGHNHLLLFKADGTVYTRGQNYSGQLGDGTLVQRRSLVVVVNATLDGFLNLNKQSAADVPPEYHVPFFVSTSGEIAGARPSLSTRTQFNPLDIGKPGAVFVTARVPKGAIPVQPIRNPEKMPAARLGAQVLGDMDFEVLQLTANGWAILIDDELFPYITGILGDLLAAQTILDFTDPDNFLLARYVTQLCAPRQAAQNSASATGQAQVPWRRPD